LVAAIEEALLTLEHRDYATAGGLFEALGKKTLASSEVQKSGLATVAPPEAVALEAGPISGADSEASSNRQHRWLRLFHSSTWGFAWICLWQRRREGAAWGSR
jgi:hypothetical protein